MNDNLAILIPDATYHIYNRANGNERLFASQEHYDFFLRKYEYHISPFADTFCYCLMPNHFHFLVRIKSSAQLAKPCQSFKTLTGFSELSETQLSTHLSRQFAHFQNGYTQAFNKQQNRRGSLFMRPFKRKRIANENYLKILVHYIHHNPVDAGICRKPGEWAHSSYNSIISLNPTHDLISKDEVIDWFEDRENFIAFHRRLVNAKIEI